MHLSRFLPIPIGLIMIGCGGGEPADLPDDMKLYTAIDGYLHGARACLVTYDEIKAAGDSGVVCHDVEGGRSKVTIDGFVAFETKDVKPFFMVDIVPEFVIDKAQVGYSKRRYQLISEKNGAVASPFSTVAHLMGVSMEDVAALTGLSPELLREDYVKVALDEGDYDAIRAQAIGRSIVRELPKKVTPSAKNRSKYQLLLAALKEESYKYTEEQLKSKEFVVNWQDGAVKGITAKDLAIDLVKQLAKEDAGWVVRDESKSLNHKIMRFNGDSVDVESLKDGMSYGDTYSVDKDGNLVFGNGGVERFFYSSSDFMLSDQVVPSSGMGKPSTAKLWLNGESKLDGKREEVKKDWSVGRTVHVVALDPNDGNNGYPIHYRMKFGTTFEEVVQGEYPYENCLYQKSRGTALSWDGHSDPEPKSLSFEVRFDCEDKEFRDESISRKMKILFNKGGSMQFSPLSKVFEDGDVTLMQGDNSRLYLFTKEYDLAANIRWRWAREHTKEEL